MEQVSDGLKTAEGPGGRRWEAPALLLRIAELEAREEEQARQLRELKADRDLYRTVADFSSDWEHWIDAAGTLRYVSPSCEAITGYPPEFFLSSPSSLEKIIHPDDRNAAAEQDRRAGCRDASIYFRILTRDRRERWIAQRCRMVYDAEGRWLGRRFSNRDVTEVVREEEKKSRSSDVIERLSRQTDIIAGIGRLINSTLEIDEVYERFVSEASKLIPCDRISINLKTPDENSFTIAVRAGMKLAGCGRGAVVPGAGTISETIVETRAGMFINAVTPAEILRRFPGCRARETFRKGTFSILGVPLISRNCVIGSLVLWRKAKKAFDDQDLRLLDRIGHQIAGAVANAQLFARLRETEASLRKTLDELERRVQERTFELQEVNTALRVLLRKREADHIRVGEQLQSNVGQLVMPFLKRLKEARMDQHGLACIKVVETSLNDILSPFVNQLSVMHKNLTPREVQIAALITQGKRSSEIAFLLGCTLGTVISHRNNIRKKLKLRGSNANLRSHLLALQ